MRVPIVVFGCLISFVVINCQVKKPDYKQYGIPKEKLDIEYNDKATLERLVAEVDRELNGVERKQYKSDWVDLDNRPLPSWYDKAKIGIFIHWGVYSVPGFKTEWFWYFWRKFGNKEFETFMTANYPLGFTYQEFAPMFTAEFFQPIEFANLFALSGAKYVVLTSKHHDGYTLFPSERSFSWNSVDVGPHRDLVGELADAVRRAGLKFGIYYSLYEWFNPMYLRDKEAKFTTKTYVDYKLWPEVKHLVNKYKPSVLWSDGDWEAKDTYWNSTDLLTWLYNESPVKDEVVVNDRWGEGTRCRHGDFYTCADRYNPGKLQDHKWENAFTLNKLSWGYDRNMKLSEVLTTRQLLREVISTVSCGGNALIDVGPTKEGTISPIFEERLLALGKWLLVNGEAIYGSSPWLFQNDTIAGKVWYTCTKIHDRNHYISTGNPDVIVAVYASFLDWPKRGILYLSDVTDLLADKWEVEMLGYEGVLKWKTMSFNRTAILLPRLDSVKFNHGWTLKFRPQDDERVKPDNTTKQAL